MIKTILLKENFQPIHINADYSDFLGNKNIGRYCIIPGSLSRAKELADNFINVKVKKSPRGHDLYTGQLKIHGKLIDVCTISSGMGTPSTEIIVTELIQLGCRRFLRLGTCGGMLQSMEIGDIAIATGAARDENASAAYLWPEIPCVADYHFLNACKKAESITNKKCFYGISHSKSSLYGKEFGYGPLGTINNDYVNKLPSMGVILSEMEASIIFALAQIYNADLIKNNPNIEDKYLIRSCCVCMILSVKSEWKKYTDKIFDKNQEVKNIKELFDYIFEVVYQMNLIDQK